ncbi:hypothetical protein A3F86_04975 [candidate division WOR-1 bacterium RIFCSPLOWO2_12_FULL_45_9]|uniref:Nucleotidyl transferase AbiEii/AbiGii toxin family protein n=1 Tax=candidate division WOR-1 bacterium RIFCSPLOWO2_12_FULL_45_9 TaxID=1802568 RepID=A0A1F4RN51_UNCSA|nr:MAG: hypothetical protein A3F86_04975 [candidate division WOR-1 bacterium RIFCSPLOWO2_12_FULL_45_9]
MKELVKIKLAGLKTADEKYNFLREFLQELILQIIDRHKYFKHLAFVGGTALRVIYDLPRFSEDLDFCLIHKQDFDFAVLLETLKRELALNGFEVDIVNSTKRTVYGSFIKFKNILHETGLSAHASEKLLIKLEIDSNPPAGYKTEISLINKNFLFKVGHYELPSLFAGKLHAFLFRKYVKGRDFYDFLWFLTRKTAINYSLLNAAAQQTEKKALKLDAGKLKELLIKKIRQVNFNHIRNELAPFLADKHELEYFQAEHFLKLIEKEFAAAQDMDAR